jgi:hypothetical protein
LASESTENARNASAELALLSFGLLFVSAPLVLGEAAEADAADALDRKRSAHEAGAAFAGSDAEACGEAASAAMASPIIVCELSVVADGESAGTGVCDETLSGSGVSGATEGLRVAVTGILGIIGTTGRVAVLVWVCAGVVVWRTEDGVVGCSESISEGACEVAGVSCSEGAAIVDVCDSVWPSVFSAVFPSIVSGSASGSFVTCTTVCPLSALTSEISSVSHTGSLTSREGSSNGALAL